jgi:hypothetical protein
MKDKASWSAQSSIMWSIKGIGKLSLGQARLRSRKSIQTRIVPYFLLTRMGLETHDVYAMGYMNPVVRNFSISALMATNLDGCNGHCFCRIGVISGHVSIRCSTIEGSRLGISVYDQEKMSWYSWNRDF